MLILHPGSTNLIEWDAMQFASNGAFVNNATVSYVVKDAAGNAVAGASGSLAYVAASDGKYQGTVPNTVSLTIGAGYTTEITATAGGVTVKPVIETAVENLDENFE